jgi:succinyl-CoA synthetase beta subunit
MIQKTGGLVSTQLRHLNLHEYQSKDLMSKFGVRVQKGQVATSYDEVLRIAKEHAANGAEEVVIKAQIHAGGRGKGHFDNGFKGGVHWATGADKAEEVADKAKHFFGAHLITKQTGPEGQLCQKVLVHEGIGPAEKEYYFAILMDRAHNGPVIVASRQGGMDIEEVAEKDPDAIFTQPVDIEEGITDAQVDKVAQVLGFEGPAFEDAKVQMKGLYAMFVASDATQVEINPLVMAKDGLVYCVDAKINFDENASFRQKEIFQMRDFSMEDQREVEASKFNLNYIGLDGNIGCMVNGAGLAMATMDIIQMQGGSPANFLDVGGGANEDQVEQAFKILTSDPKVEALLVNIFGGIMKCDVIARGIVNAAKKIDLKLPLIVRLEGTNVEQGNQILQESGLALITAVDLDDAAQKAVKAIS